MKSNLIYRVLKINNSLFPYLIGLSFIFLALESYTYIGFLRKYIFVDSRFFLVFSVLSISLVVFFQITDRSYKVSFLESLILSLNKILLPFSTIAYYAMTILNSVKYSNYIFSTVHIQPQNFLNIVLLSLSIYVLNTVNQNKGKKWIESFFNGMNAKQIFLSVLAFVIFLGFLVTSFFKTTEGIVTELAFISTHLNYTYDQKMQDKWGILYKYISLVKDNSQIGSSMVLPESKSPHSVDGRIEYFRYFLPNRKLVNYSVGINLEDYDYILLAKGYLHPTYDGVAQKEYIWPGFPIKSEEIIYLDGQGDGNYIESTIHSNYNPDDHIGKDIWGIIKIKK